MQSDYLSFWKEEPQSLCGISAGVIGTQENLAEAAGGEITSGRNVSKLCQVARDEGFEAIASVFDSIAVAEKQHAKRYEALMANIDEGQVFKRDKLVVWRCLNCGYVYEGTEPPKACPHVLILKPTSSFWLRIGNKGGYGI